jgi:flagellar basal-body rod protein FlgC
MPNELLNAMTISSSGMKAQGARIRVISQNLANSGTAANTPNEDPYARQVVTFKNVLDKTLGNGATTVAVKTVEVDRKTPFPTRYMPDHPGADANGYVKMPNVTSLIEMADMREAQRSYEANLGMITMGKSMMLRTIDMINR